MWFQLFTISLSYDITRKYWKERTESDDHIESVKDRMLNPLFVDDMKFIESLLGTGVMVNDITGGLSFIK